MITFTPFQVSALITAVSSIFFGLFVYFSGEKTKLNLSWLFASSVIGLWSLGFFGLVFSTNISTAWFWQYILDIGGICIPILYFNFLLHLLKRDKKLMVLQVFALLAATFLIILNFTTLYKTGVSPKFGINYWIDPGRLYFLFPLYFALFAVISTYVVAKEYRLSTDRDRKRQLMYVLLAQIFGFGGGFTDFFPQVFNTYPFGNYFVILYVIFISYAALKHHLFDMRVIATELLTFAIWAVLLVRTLLSNAINDLLVNIVVLVAVVVVGILLMRSVLKEVLQKEKIEKISKELEGAYVVEKKANIELQNLDKYKDDFLRQTQHDLKNPLTVIMGYVDLLLAGNFGKVTKKASDVLKRIEVVAQDKVRDVNNFLDTEQFKMGKKVVSLKPGVVITPILKEVVDRLLYQAELGGIYLKLDIAENMHAISADREKLKSAIFNIVHNSVKYTKTGGVNIKAESNGVVKIIVSDTGIGIPKDKLATILEGQFERTEEAQKTASGSGVGLYLSAQIIKLHNGKVWAESAGEGKGSTFYIELPIG